MIGRPCEVGIAVVLGFQEVRQNLVVTPADVAQSGPIVVVTAEIIKIVMAKDDGKRGARRQTKLKYLSVNPVYA